MEVKGQVSLEYLIMTIFVVIPMLLMIGYIVHKLAYLYHVEDLMMKIPIL